MDRPFKLIALNDHELLLCHRLDGGWVAVLFGGFVFYAGLFGHAHDWALPWLGFLAIGLLFAVAGVVTALRREQLSLDAVTRRYAYSHGFLWRVRRESGSLDALEAITLSTQTSGGGRGGIYTAWVVALQFTSAVGAVSLEAERTESDARALAETLIQTFRVSLIDWTVEPPAETSWQELATSLMAEPAKNTWQTASPVQISPPPPGSGILFTQLSGRYSITLPPAGIRAEALLVIAFMSIFVYVGGLALLGGVRAVLNGAESYWLAWIIGGMFSLIGIGNMIQGIGTMWAREWLRDEGDSLVLGHRLMGIEYGKTRIEKNSILNVAVSPAESAQGNRARLNQALRTKLPLIGSWQASVAILQQTGRQLLGTALCATSQQWLVEALRSMCGLHSQ
jgi:hypothetical protein